jgi:hypothetical protein
MFGTIARVAPLAWLVLAGSVAHGAAVQVLDSVDVFGRDSTTATSTVLEMAFREPARTKDFARLSIGSTSSLIACQRAADQGLYCLDGPVVRYWPNTEFVSPPVTGVVPDIDLIDCRASATVLGLDTKRPNPCTSITVDLTGAIWLAGRKANSHSLFKAVKTATNSCSAPWVLLPPVVQDAPNTADTPAGEAQSYPRFCAREYASGRPILVDINPVDGEVAANFTGPGILGLEERKTVVFFPDPSSGIPLEPVTIASGKTDWGLIGNEQLMSAAFLQIEAVPASEAAPAVPLQNFVVVTTTLGRVLATKADGPGVGFKVWDVPACTASATQNYGIRVSSQSERVYLADRACQKVYSLKWSNVADGHFDLIQAVEGSGNTPVVLRTASADSPPTTSVFPDGLSVAPGIGIDLRDCGFNANGTPKTCPWVPDGADRNSPDNQFNAAEVSGVRIESNGKSKMTVFQVRGIPDCRYWDSGPGCVSSLVDGGRLNITELLPQEIKSQYPVTGEGSLPELWISEEFRGQESSPGQYTIDLFWTITEPGVQFRDTFRMSFDVGDLTDGVKNGCGGSTTSQPDLNWNVVVTGSEKYKVVDGDNLAHVETLVNDGCSNPDGVTSKRFSYYAYNLEVVPNGDAVYWRMVRSLFDDILSTQQKTACESYDLYPPPPAGSVLAPFDKTTTCANLETKWSGANDKLQKCLSGTKYPRQSEAVNNCNSFLSQLGQYESALNASPRLGQDPANRIGELKARVKVLRYVFQQHFVPSIPQNGFCNLTGVTCPQ